MADNTDLDLAIVADSEPSSDDDFKPSVRKVGLNRKQLALNASRIPKRKKQQEQQPEKKLVKKEDEDEKSHRLVEDLNGDGGRQKACRRQLTEREVTPRENAIVNGRLKRPTTLSVAELDNFRYTRGVGGIHALKESVPMRSISLMENTSKSLEVVVIDLDSPTEMPGPEQLGPEHFGRIMENTSDCLEIAAINVDSETEMHGPDQLGAKHFGRVMENTSNRLEVAAINVDSETEVHVPDQFGNEHFGRIMENTSDRLEVAAINVKSQTEWHGPEQLEAEHFGRSRPAAYHAEECVVVDIATDEIVELCDETQFSVLLRLCGEECEQDEFRIDVPDVDRVPLEVYGPSVSAFELASNLVPNRGGRPGCELMEGPGSTEEGIISTNLTADKSVPKEVLEQSAIAYVTNSDDADQPVVQEGNDGEDQKSQDQFCDDFISSMMTQICVSPREEVKSPRRIPPSPLKNISNLPARFVKNNQRVNVKFINQAAKRMESKCTKSEDSLDKGESVPLQGSMHRVLQLDKSSKDHCQNKENVRDSPRGVTIEDNPAVSGNAMERPNCSEPHESVGEDFVLYSGEVRETIKCPVCAENISGISVEERVAHTNSCLDKLDTVQEGVPQDEGDINVPASDLVKAWLEKLNLSRFISVFVEQEIDWDTIPWLTEEDLMLMGINAVGPRRKIFQAIQELKREGSGGRTEPQKLAVENTSEIHMPAPPADTTSRIQQANGGESNNLITNYFPLPPDSVRNQLREESATTTVPRKGIVRNTSSKRPRSSVYQTNFGIPSWMCIRGTPFRVDAFQHLSGDCCHWFLTHFHTDHYQGLTRGFRYGHIFCSSITARLVNLRIGVSWEKLMIIPLHEKVKIAGVDVTFIDANHCPGSVMILFEPPNGEAVLHTGDFRFCPEMANNSLLQKANIHTLVLDTTYCDPQYDFPTQDMVIRFVIEAIQAEMFNSDTLFLIGTYTIGKERIFLEVGKVLKKYVYVGAPKKKLLDFMDLSADDTKWLTCNEHQSFIHVVPLWSISSFKRMDSIARHYQGKYKLIVAFSPTGWSFRRGKKKTPGKRWKRGTMIRYEVPYSEHCSFSELREFLRFVSPEDIIPSVPGKDGVGADAMIASLWSEDQGS